MDKLNWMKRLLWGMIVIFLLQPVFSSIQNHDHFISEPRAGISVLLAEQEAENVLDFHHVSKSKVSQESSLQSFHKEIDCCQSLDMGNCLMGCYFIPLGNSVVIIQLKTESPLDLLMSWHSYFMVSENPPPRWFV